MDTKDIVIATATAQGMNQEMIEATTGIPQSTVSRRLRKPEIKELIERIQQELIEDTAEKTKEIITNLINGYEANDCQDKQREIEKLHAFKCIQRMAETMGIFPSHTPSVLIQQVFNQPDHTNLEALNLLRAFIKHKAEACRSGVSQDDKTDEAR